MQYISVDAVLELLAQFQGQAVETGEVGTPAAAGSNILHGGGKSWPVDAFKSLMVEVYEGVGSHQARVIGGNGTNALVIVGAWEKAIGVGAKFRIKALMDPRPVLRDALRSLTKNWRLLYYEDFSSPIPHLYPYRQDDGVTERHTLRAYREHLASLQLKTNAVADSRVGCQSHIGGFHTRKMLFHTVFAAGRNLDEFRVNFPSWNPEGLSRTGGFRFTSEGAGHLRNLYIYTTLAWDQLIKSWEIGDGLYTSSNPTFTTWHTVDLVVDYPNQRYVSITVNGDYYDLSAYTTYTVAPPGEPANMPLRYTILTEADEAQYAWLGEVAVSEEE